MYIFLLSCALVYSFVRALGKDRTILSLHRKARTLEQTLCLYEEERTAYFFLLKKAYDQFKQQQTERFLEVQRLAAVGRVTTALLHDISDALTCSTLLTEQQKDGKTQHVLKGLRYMTELIRSTRKQFVGSTVRKSFNVATEIRDVHQFLVPLLKEKHVTCLLALEKGVYIRGDPCQFHRSVTNLVSNAVDSYEDKKSCTSIPMSLGRREVRREVHIVLKKSGQDALISVQDFGVGIKKEHQKYIFTPLFTTKLPAEGTGIGLAATREVIEKFFRGHISFSSRENVGTRFVVTIPLAS